MPSTSDSQIFEELVVNNPAAKKILAEGDSWLAYPRKYVVVGSAANIVDQLGKRNNLVIYTTASNGDEAVAMLSGDQKFSLLKRLKYIEFDYLLFSGGGNDIVGRYDFGFLLNSRKDGGTWQDCINEERLAIKIQQLKGTYELLCQLVPEFSKNKNIKIVTHTYDHVIPSKEGFHLFDIIPLGKSWMYPFLKDKNIVDGDSQRQIVNYIMGKFRDMLLEVQNKYGSILTVVDTQGTVAENEWRNEIHPTSAGFKKVADKIYDEGLR